VLGSLRGSEKTGDAAQQAYLQVAANVDKFRGEASVSTRVWSIAGRVSINRNNRRLIERRKMGVSSGRSENPEELSLARETSDAVGAR